MNLYDKLRMRGTTAQSAAASIFRTSAPSAPVVARPNVASMFDRAGTARSSLDARSALNYVLGQAGVGLGRLGRLGALGDGAFPIFGPYSFGHSCAFHYFMSSAVIDSAISSHRDANNYQFLAPYTAVRQNLFGGTTPQSISRDAQVGYEYLQQEIRNGSALAKAHFDVLDEQIKNHIDAAEGILAVHDSTMWCDAPNSRPWGETLRAFEELYGVKRAMEAFAAAPSTIPPVAGVGQQVDASHLDLDIVTRSRLTSTTHEAEDALANGRSNPWYTPPAIPDLPDSIDPVTGQQQQALTADGGLPGWILPVGLGLGLVGVAFVVLKKKK